MENWKEWSTEALPESEQFDLWEEIVREAFVPTDITRRDEGAFPSRVRGRRAGPVGISRIQSPAQSVHRGPRHLIPITGDVYFLNLPLSSGTWAKQDGRIAHLTPGDFAIVDSSRPFELGFGDHFEQVSLTIPHDLIAARLTHPEEATAVRVDGGSGLGAVASAAIRAFAGSDAPLDSAAARSLIEHLAGLIGLAIGGVSPALAASPRALLAQAARDEIDRGLADPKLSRTQIAERLSISTRYLDRLFAEDGTSFNRWLLARRLERCRAELIGEETDARSIAEVALAAGFVDPSYFARAFKAAYGLSPGQARRSLGLPGVGTVRPPR